MPRRGVHAQGHAWLGGHVVGGMCGEGDICGEGGHAWYSHPLYEIQPVNAWAVHILLECILVLHRIGQNYHFSFCLRQV